jgi:hypothetical protein
MLRRSLICFNGSFGHRTAKHLKREIALGVCEFLSTTVLEGVVLAWLLEIVVQIIF